MDTTFIIDSSDCDDRSNWNRLLYFVQTLVTYFNVSPSGGRIALIQFSTGANVVLKFNTLTAAFLITRKSTDESVCYSARVASEG